MSWSAAQMTIEAEDEKAASVGPVSPPLSPWPVALTGSIAGLAGGALVVWVLYAAGADDLADLLVAPLLWMPTLLGAAAANHAAPPGAWRAIRIAITLTLAGHRHRPGRRVALDRERDPVARGVGARPGIRWPTRADVRIPARPALGRCRSAAGPARTALRMTEQTASSPIRPLPEVSPASRHVLARA